MMSLPSRGVRLPVDGLTGWGEAARRTGEGISAALAGSAQIMREQARVSAAGELADFSEKLRAIDEETREELAGQEVQDWGYAWQKASSAKVSEALDELSSDSRGAGRELAEAYFSRAALEARRDHELQKIDKARAQWRNRVEDAVQAGDTQQAREWLDAGQGLFVPQQKMPDEQAEVQSRAQLHRWQNELQQQPLRALGMLSAAPEEELPGRRQDAERLAHAKGQAGRAARQEVVQGLLSCMDEELSPEPEFLRMAQEAGVLTPQQVESAQAAPQKMTSAARRDWLRRVDELPEDEDEAEKLRLEIVTAALPAAERRSLLKRMELSRTLPVRDRRQLSRGLWDLYCDGALGCPEDEEAQEYFAALQQESLNRLAQEGSRGATDWVRGMRDMFSRSLCFDSNTSAS